MEKKKKSHHWFLLPLLLGMPDESLWLDVRQLPGITGWVWGRLL